MRKQHQNPVPADVKIYYVRQDKQIVGTVAFKPNEDGTVNRGIAVTGLGESGGRKIGRKIAINRLLIAETERESSRPMNFKRDSIARFAMHYEGDLKDGLCKCGVGVEPNAFEQRIVECTSSN